MVNSWYDAGLEGFAGGDVAWDTDNIRCVLIDEGTDVPDLANDDFLDDIAGGARVALGTANLGSKTFLDGVLDGADYTFTSVSGATVESFTVFVNTGTESTSRLLLNFDTATGLVLTPDGGNVTIQWDNGSNRIARL